MRAIFISVIAAFFTFHSNAHATPRINVPIEKDNLPKEGSFAFGFSLGTNSSLSAKYWITSEAAVDLAVENSRSPWEVYYADFLWHFPKLFGSASKFARETTLYVGAGLGGGHWQRSEDCGRWHCSWSTTTSGSGTGMFARALVGMEWYPARAERLGVYGEVAPSVLLYPSGHAFDYAVGARYYFF